MTSPVTPDPSVHTDPTASTDDAAELASARQTLQSALSGLPAEIVELIVNAILSALGLGSATGTVDDILTALFDALSDIPQGNISGLEADLGTAFTTAMQALGLASLQQSLTGALQTAQQAVSNELGSLIDTLVSYLKDGESVINSTIGDVESVLDNIPLIGQLLQAITGSSGTGSGTALSALEGWFQDLQNLLGVGQSGGTSTTSPPSLSDAQSLQQLLGWLGTNTPVPANLFAALAPGTSTNVQGDPSFSGNWSSSGSPYGDVNGQGLWYWDGFQGNSAPGSVRTRRNGVITVFWVTGTWNTNVITSTPSWSEGIWPTMKLYFTDPEAESLGFYAVSGEGINQGIDHTYFEFVNVYYGACLFPMKSTLSQGVANLIQLIKATPGPFILTGWSQGAQVISNVYDLIRYGSYNDGCNSLTDASLMSRNADLLAGIALGNPRRQAGFTFPGFPDPAPGTAGINSVQLSDCEDRWWEICLPDDPAATVSLTSQVGLWMRVLWKTIVEQGTAGGSEYAAAVEDFLTSGNWIDFIELIVDPSQISAFIQAVDDYFQLTTHDSYWDAQGLVARGDDRTFGQIILDYIGTFSHLSTPPVNGIRHQMLGVPAPVQPYQVVTAGASVMWQFVVGSGPQMLVAVNAYDVNNNLIATVTANEATISDPESTSDWNWQTLSASFVMPAGAASACLVLDAEPEAMTTGIVWFDDAVFEISTLIDSALLDVTNMPALTLAQVQGPQGVADLLTAWQNLIDAQVSATGQTNTTGAQFAQMLQSLGQTAISAEQALALGIASQQVIANVSTQPLWSGMQPTGQVTFPLPAGTLSTVTVSSGMSLMGFINTNPAVTVGFVEFMAEGSGGSGVYLNLYGLDPTTGNLTSLWSSSDISSQVPSGSYGWVGVDIASADQPSLALGQWACWEIVAQGMTIEVVAQTYSTPTKGYAVAAPANMGASRTTSSTGGASPSSLTSGQVTYGGSLPFVCMSVSDVPPTYQPPNQMSWQNNGTYIYTIPGWMQPGDFIDVVLLGAGGGGGAAIIGKNFDLDLIIIDIDIPLSKTVDGQGGAAGSWTATTLVYGTDIPDTTDTLTLVVGLGGVAGVSTTAGSGGNDGWGVDGGNTTLAGTGVTTLTGAGGPAGGYAGTDNPANSNTGTTGPGPGNKVFEGRTYFGGITVSSVSYPGASPGGAGVGGIGAVPGAGADGAAWITARQSGSGINSGVGMGGGGGGSELSVVYEATGTGTYNTNSTSLPWTHTSDGGPNCGVVLIGCVYFYDGTLSVSAAYGGASFSYVLDDSQYFSNDGYSLFLFAVGLIGPSSGEQDIVLATTGTATIEGIAGNTLSYQNVGSFGNWHEGSGKSTAPALSGIDAETGELVVAGFAGANHVLNSFNQTSRWSQTTLASSVIPMVIGDAAGATVVNFSASTTASDYWGAVGGILIPVS